MADLKFNTDTMEIATENGDFVLETNPSVQNGYLMLTTKNVNLYRPTLGVGINNSILNNNGIAFDLARWKQMVVADGAISALFTIDDTDQSFKTFIKYGNL